ncbi:unnamed protein product, partial [Linum tenue]
YEIRSIELVTLAAAFNGRFGELFILQYTRLIMLELITVIEELVYSAAEDFGSPPYNFDCLQEIEEEECGKDFGNNGCLVIQLALCL